MRQIGEGGILGVVPGKSLTARNFQVRGQMSLVLGFRVRVRVRVIAH